MFLIAATMWKESGLFVKLLLLEVLNAKCNEIKDYQLILYSLQI